MDTPAPDGPRPFPAPPALSVTITDLAQGVIVHLEGKADTTAVDRLQFVLMRVIARRVPLVVLDLSELTFLCSLAMGALIGLRRALARWGGCVKLAAGRPEIQETLEIAGLLKLFDYCTTLEEATAAG